MTGAAFPRCRSSTVLSGCVTASTRSGAGDRNGRQTTSSRQADGLARGEPRSRARGQQPRRCAVASAKTATSGDLAPGARRTARGRAGTRRRAGARAGTGRQRGTTRRPREVRRRCRPPRSRRRASGTPARATTGAAPIALKTPRSRFFSTTSQRDVRDDVEGRHDDDERDGGEDHRLLEAQGERERRVQVAPRLDPVRGASGARSRRPRPRAPTGREPRLPRTGPRSRSPERSARRLLDSSTSGALLDQAAAAQPGERGRPPRSGSGPIGESRVRERETHELSALDVQASQRDGGR